MDPDAVCNLTGSHHSPQTSWDCHLKGPFAITIESDSRAPLQKNYIMVIATNRKNG